MSNRKIFRVLWITVLVHVGITWVLAIRRGWRARRLQVREPGPLPYEMPPVSVIVPAWNEKGTIERNIRALQAVDYPDWEAIILAGGDDGTYAAATRVAAGDDRFRVLERGPEPKNAALNRGIQAAQHDILVLLDCDNIVEPGWLRALITPIVNGAAVSVGDSRPNCITWVTLEERMWNIHTYQVLQLSWIQGDRSIAIRRDLLERIGGLPEHTYAREDWDIWARLGETGEQVAFAEGARLTTDRPATLKESWKHQVRFRRTHLVGMWEHRSALFEQPADFFRQVYGYLLSAVLGLSTLAGLIIFVIRPALRSTIYRYFLLGIVWLGGRQASVAGEVAAFTGDWCWVPRAWMPAINLFLIIPSSIVALLTPASLNPYYKGPRHSSDSPITKLILPHHTDTESRCVQKRKQV